MAMLKAAKTEIMIMNIVSSLFGRFDGLFLRFESLPVAGCLVVIVPTVGRYYGSFDPLLGASRYRTGVVRIDNV